jgi:hypothetical protein
MAELNQLFSPQTLQDVSIQYRNAQYIGAQIFPIIKVPKPAGRFFKYGQADFFTYVNDLADHRSNVQEVEVNYETASYATEFHSNFSFVSNDEIEAADVPLAPLIDATNRATDNVMLGHEIRSALLAFDPANFSSAQKDSPATKWDAANSTPVQNILAAIDGTFGNDPVYAAIGLDAYRVLQSHPDILEAFHFVSSGAVASRQQIAQFFGLKDLFVGESRKMTASKGQTPTYARIWGDAMLLFRRPDAPSPRSASFGYTFAWRDREVFTQPNLMRGGGSGGVDVKVSFAYDIKIAAEPAAFLLHDVLT